MFQSKIYVKISAGYFFERLVLALIETIIVSAVVSNHAKRGLK